MIRKSFIEIILSRLKEGERGTLDIREKNYHINVISFVKNLRTVDVSKHRKCLIGIRKYCYE